MLKILALTRYGRLGASSRLRSFQYFDYLTRHGCELVEEPLFSDAYLDRLYHGGRRHINVIIAAYVRRLLALMRRRNFDLLWFEVELLPWLPFMIESALLGKTQRCVVDFDDAIFHRYDRHPSRFVRRVLGNKIASVMRRADAVVVGSHYLADYAHGAGAGKVALLPTVVDLKRYVVTDRSGVGGRIGWIGTPLTARQYLPLIYPVLLRLAEQRKFTLVLIGAGEIEMRGLCVESHDWSADSEAALVSSLDIGLMPLVDGPWERGKCGYKLIQYMACGVPVVASDVGENRYIVHHGEHGYLVRSDEGWFNGLATLLDDPEGAREMGSAGRRRVEECYSKQVMAPRLLATLRQAAGCI